MQYSFIIIYSANITFSFVGAVNKDVNNNLIVPRKIREKICKMGNNCFISSGVREASDDCLIAPCLSLEGGTVQL